MLKFNGVLIDFDGTLVDSLPILKQSFHEFLFENSIAETPITFESINGPPLTEIVKLIKCEHGLQSSEKKLLGQYQSIISKQYLQALPAVGVREFLSHCHRERLPVCIVTSNTRGLVRRWLQVNKLDSYIASIVAAEDVRQGKPSPEPYVLGLQRLGLKEHEVIAIEDSYQGAVAALTAGLQTYLVSAEEGIDESSFDEANQIMCVSSFKELMM